MILIRAANQADWQMRKEASSLYWTVEVPSAVLVTAKHITADIVRGETTP